MSGTRPPGAAAFRAAFLICAVIAQAASGPATAAPATAAPATGLPSGARELVARGDASRLGEDWYGAVEAYLAAVKVNPSYGEALRGLVECYYALEEYGQALSWARKAEPLLLGDAALADLEGFVHIGTGDIEAARAKFTSVLARLPNDLDARFGLALLDLAAGRKTDARVRLEDSLRLAPQNARALLSLALVARDQGRAEESRGLIERALRLHGEEARVQYAASRLSALDGDAEGAIRYAHAALDISPSYSDARRLLGTLLYGSGAFEESMSLMREAVARDRKDARAWFTLGLSQAGAKRDADALYSFRTALGLAPEDEVARLALEALVMDSTPLEDRTREPLADWHFRRAAELEGRSLSAEALLEYRRGLRIWPYSVTGRTRYAELIRKRGFPARQLEELAFLRDLGKADTAVLDSIETYDSLLVDSVTRAWSVDQFAEAKRPYRVALFHDPAPAETWHTAADEVVTRYFAEILGSSTRLGLAGAPRASSSAGDAFRQARETEADYYLVLQVRETDREVELRVELRVARTGSLAASFRAYRTGNDRVKNAASRLAEQLDAALQPKGRILARNQDRALVDLGRADGFVAGDLLLVLKRGSLAVLHEGLGPAFAAEDVIGELSLTRVDEEVAEGMLRRSGFFDVINAGDQVLRAPAAAAPVSGTGAATKPPAGSTAPAPAGSAAAGTKAAAPASEPEWPGLFTEIRKFR